MADIIKDDVRTYVEELIRREFSSKSKEGKVLWDNRKPKGVRPHYWQHYPFLRSSVEKRTASK